MGLFVGLHSKKTPSYANWSEMRVAGRQCAAIALNRLIRPMGRRFGKLGKEAADWGILVSGLSPGQAVA
jgi:hypothetical protein